MKLCKKCKTEKELTEFYNVKTNKDGKSNWCKECNRKISKKESIIPEILQK
jgi:superfamily II helicase